MLAAFKAAKQAGADVKIIYHGLDDDTGNTNDAGDRRLRRSRAICIPRTNAKLMHNKFIVLSKNGKPVSVWTGSTNYQPQCAVRPTQCRARHSRSALARRFLAYWNELKGDPVADDIKDWAEANNALPPADESDALTPIFSPHRGRGVFDWWIELANAPQAAVHDLSVRHRQGLPARSLTRTTACCASPCWTNTSTAGTPASRAAAIADIERIRRYPNIGMALGNSIFVDWIDGWHQEGGRIGVNVNWVHTKFMLIDPLGNKPITLTGSANFSEASVNTNDENMLLIRGDKRVADIYFGEFMRVFAHHRFRESVKRHIEQFGSAAFNTWKPQDLFEDWRKWVPMHFKKGSEHDIKRRLQCWGTT